MNEEKRKENAREGQYLTFFISFELKKRLKALAKKYDRTTSDMVRSVLKMGIPMMEGLS